MGGLTNTLVTALGNFKRTFGLNQLIVEPTHKWATGESVIDLILVSDHKNVIQSGVISVGLSDHMLIYCTRKVTKVKTYSHNTVMVRSLKNYT